MFYKHPLNPTPPAKCQVNISHLTIYFHVRRNRDGLIHSLPCKILSRRTAVLLSLIYRIRKSFTFRIFYNTESMTFKDLIGNFVNVIPLLCPTSPAMSEGNAVDYKMIVQSSVMRKER